MSKEQQTEALRIAACLRERSYPVLPLATITEAARTIEKLHTRVQELEALQAQRVPLPLSEILHYAGEQGFVRVQGDNAFHIFIDGADIASCLEAMARDIERAHGIGVGA